MPSNKPESRLIRAAGAVAWRPGPDGEPEILLVHRKKYDDWSLPKGKMEPGEPLPVTAAREVLEEGGAGLALGRRLISVRYNVGGRPKRVHYWSARVTSTDDHAVPNSEVDLIAWVPAAHAVGRVSYAHDHGVLADFARLPAPTVPLILLRHAKAVGKSDWKRGDASRPLDDSGRADAKSLADLLACFAPSPRLISSPAARCVDTLRPFAELSGAQVREEPSLYIHHKSGGTGRGDSSPSMTDLVREAIATGEPTVLCAHRENIPDLQAAALAAVGAELASGDDGPINRQTRKEWDTALPTSGFWVLNLELAPAPPPSADKSSADKSSTDKSSADEPSADEPSADEPSEGSPSADLSPVTSPSADPSPADATSPAPARWRWLFGRNRNRNGGRDRVDGAVDSPASDPVLEPNPRPEPRPERDSGPGPRDAPRQTAVLISADRYDLTEV